MIIRNINGNSKNSCKCASLLDHWKRFSGQSVPTYCPAKNCHEKDLVGAHVQKVDYNDKSWYIYILCKKHNVADGMSVEVSDTYKLLSADVSDTCGEEESGD